MYIVLAEKFGRSVTILVEVKEHPKVLRDDIIKQEINTEA